MFDIGQIDRYKKFDKILLKITRITACSRHVRVRDTS